MTSLKNFIVYWLPPMIWMAFIFPTNKNLTADSTSHILVPIIKWLLPHAGQDTIEILHIGIRKIFHFFNYAFLAFLLVRGFRMGKKNRRWKWIVYAGLIAVAYGSIDEYIQSFIPSRTGSFHDWLIDSAGVLFTLGITSGKIVK